MESIERRARELLEIAANAEHYGIDYHEERLIRESDVLAALVAALTPTDGYVVVTRNEAGQAVAVTRQDDDCRILSVIADLEYPQWQPIEAAPKDGQYILACDEDSTLVTRWTGLGWYEGEDRYEYFYWEPSHWIPLPPRPEKP